MYMWVWPIGWWDVPITIVCEIHTLKKWWKVNVLLLLSSEILSYLWLFFRVCWCIRICVGGQIDPRNKQIHQLDQRNDQRSMFQFFVASEACNPLLFFDHVYLCWGQMNMFLVQLFRIVFIFCVALHLINNYPLNPQIKETGKGQWFNFFVAS